MENRNITSIEDHVVKWTAEEGLDAETGERGHDAHCGAVSMCIGRSQRTEEVEQGARDEADLSDRIRRVEGTENVCRDEIECCAPLCTISESR